MLRVQADGHVIQQGDARMASTYRAALGEERADLLHADPPYCLLVRRNARGRKRDPKHAKINHTAVRRFEDLAEYRRFTERWLRPALATVSKAGHAIVWTNLLGREPIRDVALSAGFVEHGTFLWAKLGKGGNAGEQLARLYEVALIFGRTAAPELTEAGLLPPRHHISGYDDDGEASHWEHHPNHKPFSLLEPLIRAYSQPGDVVLEPFSGSGSTAAAAVRLGRRARAIELRAKWAGVSGQRLQAETVGREPPSPSS